MPLIAEMGHTKYSASLFQGPILDIIERMTARNLSPCTDTSLGLKAPKPKNYSSQCNPLLLNIKMSVRSMSVQAWLSVLF